MEDNPMTFRVTNKTTDHDLLSKNVMGYSIAFKLIKVNTRLLQERFCIRTTLICGQIKPEIELPYGILANKLTILIGKS